MGALTTAAPEIVSLVRIFHGATIVAAPFALFAAFAPSYCALAVILASAATVLSPYF